MNIKNLLKLLVCILFITLNTGVCGKEAAPDWRFEGVERVVAVGDIHGDYHGMIQVLQQAGIVDQERTWTGGKTHLVVLGDSVDRGPASLRVLEFLMGLQEQAQKPGGRVHVLMGNHEAMVLAGDLRYASKRDLAAFAGEDSPLRGQARSRFLTATKDRFKDEDAARTAFEDRYPPGYFGLRAAYAPAGRYGRWLMERPLMVVINDTAFVHGGLSPEITDPDTINRRAKAQFDELLETWQELIQAGVVLPEYPLLVAADAIQRALESGALEAYPAATRAAARTLSTARQAIVFNPAGPLWYRGNAVCNPLVEEAILEQSLNALGVSRLVVSHTPTRTGQVESRMGGRLIQLDTGERPAALVIASDNLRALYAGTANPRPVLAASQNRLADVPLGTGELEHFLKTASIVAREDVGTGVTQPVRLTLEQDGIRLRAIFKTGETPVVYTSRLRQSRALSLADRYVYDIAAYRLDRLLGLDMVPVTVARTVNGTHGALQYWVENAMNERERRKQGVKPEPLCPMEKQYALLELFDRLIYNTDRTQENILYTPDWRVALIDHTRSFRPEAGIPPMVRAVSLSAAPGFAKRLEALTPQELERALDDLLDDKQIWALLERRRQMLEDWETALIVQE